MRFSRQFLDNLRARIQISSVIGTAVKLKHKSRGEFTGLCPFHKEKTPSFHVSDNRGSYHCFGCGVHGDAISFLIEFRGLPYQEAVKNLAAQAGLELPKEDKFDAVREQKAIDSYEVLELACKWFESNLESSAGMAARNYLKERGLSAETIKKFRLGLSMDGWEGLKNYLKSKNIDEEMIAANGLLASNSDGSRTYDRFRNRLMFPIFSAQGRVIAFGGRIMDNEEKGPKYLNSPETDLFKKSFTLYGFNFAKDRAYKEEKIIAVEGYMDVIALHQAGFDYTVAPLGTALTENHIKQLWKISKEPILCLDGDTAGMRASKKFAESYVTLLEPGNTIKFAFLPKEYDPDDFIKNHGGPAFEKLLSEAKPLSEALWDLNYSEARLDTPENRSEFADRMMKLAETIQNQSVKNFYKKEYSAKIYQLGNSKNASFTIKKPNQLTPELKVSLSKNVSSLENLKERLVVLCAFNPSLSHRAEVEEVLQMIDLDNKHVEKLRDNVIKFSSYTEHDDESNEAVFTDFIAYLEKQGEDNQINYLKTVSLKEEFIWFEDADAKSLFAWRYLLAEYYLGLAENEYNKLSGTGEADIQLLYEQQKELQGEILNLKRSRDERRNEFEELITRDIF